MIVTTIKEILRDTVRDDESENFRIYVVRDAETVFYVGKAERRHILERVREHFGEGTFSWAHGLSPLGALVRANAPSSEAWKVELMTVSDYTPSVQKHSPWYKTPDASIAERAMIQELCPCLNVTHNPNGQRLPEKYHTVQQSLHDAPCDHLGLQLS